MQMTRVNCLSCGHSVELSPAYDNYEGQIRCYACGALLEVKLVDGEVRSSRHIYHPASSRAEETMARDAS